MDMVCAPSSGSLRQVSFSLLENRIKMKSYNFRDTKDKDLFRVVDQSGDWTHYFHKPSGKYLRAVNHILNTGYAKGPRFYDWLKNKSAEESEKILKTAGDRGSAIHQFIERIFERGGKVDRITPVLAEDGINTRILTGSEWEAILAFGRFWEAHKPKIIASDYPVYNLTLGYAGTLDILFILTETCGVKTCECVDVINQINLCDFKSGGGIYNSYGAQIAFYKEGENLANLLGERAIESTSILRIGTNHKAGYEFRYYGKEESEKHWQEALASLTISNSEYKAFDPEKEIYDIPEVLDLKIEMEEKPKVKRKRTKLSKCCKAPLIGGVQCEACGAKDIKKLKK